MGGPSNQNSGCGRSGAYSNNSNLGYRPLASSNEYSNNYGYRVRSTPLNYGYNSKGVGSHGGFENGNHLQKQSVVPRLGANSFGYQNAGRTGNLVYDSVHGDYHTVPSRIPQQYQDNISGGAGNQNRNNSPWFGGYSGR